MQWTDTGIVLSARRYGENAAILSLFTTTHGRHSGLARGLRTQRGMGLYQSGNTLSVTWRGRLEEHLGTYSCEMARPRAALVLDDVSRLAGLSAVCSLAETTLPERFPYSRLYTALEELLNELISEGHWQEALVRWELTLLRELGFGLDLSVCAATGSTDDLIYVSPRSGRAISRNAGKPYSKNLLHLPTFLTRKTCPPVGNNQILAGLQLTGWFLQHHVFHEKGGRLPAARDRLINCLSR